MGLNWIWYGICVKAFGTYPTSTVGAFISQDASSCPGSSKLSSLKLARFRHATQIKQLSVSALEVIGPRK